MAPKWAGGVAVENYGVYLYTAAGGTFGMAFNLCVYLN